MDKVTDSLIEKVRAKDKSDLWFWIMLAVLAGIFTIILAIISFITFVLFSVSPVIMVRPFLKSISKVSINA